jgi:hypothetical protein
MKVGRNEACPCGSGRKYKRCHGEVAFGGASQSFAPLSDEVALERVKAKEIQRQRQQGLGNPIISVEHMGRRLVAIKDKIAHFPADTTKTFHDFLVKYVKGKFGQPWADEQLALPDEQRHPYFRLEMHRYAGAKRALAAQGTDVFRSNFDAGTAAYYRLAYDLYALEHNAEVQDKLLARLRRTDLFYGAQYEVFVGAALIRAGFSIEFEDEDDRRSTHVEFTATHKKTHRKFSVEAKYHTDFTATRIGRRLFRALRKAVDYPRVVFMELNTPAVDERLHRRVVEGAVTAIRRYEMNRASRGLPCAYLFLTNMPWYRDFHDSSMGCGTHDAFRIPEFQTIARFPSVSAAVEARERHREMHDLRESMKDHWEIPATFDGEIPEFAFGEIKTRRLLIGDRYLMPGPQGNEIAVVLKTATVIPTERCAFCVVMSETDNGQFMVKVPLGDAEFAAWSRHPDTFFGSVGPRDMKAESPLDLYDFFHNSYKDTPREKLLEFMSGAPDAAALSALDQPALAKLYAERCTSHILAQSAASAKGGGAP